MDASRFSLSGRRTTPDRRSFGPTARRVLVARGLRAFGDGYVSLLLPLYLLELGFGALDVGILATATLLGSGVLTLAIGMRAHRFAPRTLLLAGAVLMGATGLGLATFTAFWPLLLVAVVGTLNPSSGDASVFMPLEHTLLSSSVTDDRRTAVFAAYSLAGSLAGAFGALAAALPALIGRHAGLTPIASIQSMFVAYAVLAVVAASLYRTLPRREIAIRAPVAPLRESRRRVYTLAALFSVDAFAGGLIVQSMLALWLVQAFGLSMATTGTIFFWTGLLTALSYVAAVPLARRFGLVNTMVFTHLPSSLCLVLVPFMSDLATVLALLLVRSALSQMDVPTRSSYVMAIVPPAERPAAASLTSVPRSLAASASPALAGYLLGVSAFAWPLLAAGVIKIAYDLALLALFRDVRPPEET